MKLFARAYVGASGAIVVLAALTGTSTRWNAWPWLLACALAAGAVVVGIRTRRLHDTGFWVAIAASLVCWSLAALWQLLGGAEVSAAGYTLSSALYVPGYAALGWATVRLLRRVGLGRPETIDAAIATVLGVALIFPVVVGAVDRNGAPILWAILFPVWDTLLAMSLLRILFSPWARRRSLQLLAAASLALFASDLVYFSSVVIDSPLAARVLSASYSAAYLLFGAASLPTSMRRVPPRGLLRNTAGARRRTLAVMAFALLATPMIFGVERMVDGDRKDAVLALLGVVIVALVVVRVSHLLTQSEQLRLRAEESERLFRTVFDSAGVGISVGANGIMSRTNPALHRMLGYSGDELAQLHYTEIVHPDDIVKSADADEGVTKTFERRLIAKDGRSIWVVVTLTKPAQDQFGIAVMEDVTVAKQLEADLRQAQKMEAVGQLAGGVAHDFNNLMTAVTGYAAMLQQEIPAGDGRRSRVEAIAAAAERAAELTRKLLAFSRRQVLRLEPLEISTIVREFGPIVRRLLPENIALDYRLEPGAVARVDRGELEQVVLNLALNARDPDVLVSDVVMTGVDGPTLAARARVLLPELPVLFVSGYPAETLGDTTSERVLSKPFTPHQLAEQIERVRRAALVAA